MPGATPPSARPRRGPHPRPQGHRPAQPAVSLLLGQRRLARNHPGRHRPGHQGPPDRLPRPPDPGPRRDRHLPLPGPARRRPHHTRRPPTATAYRRHLALGIGDRHRLATPAHRLRIAPRPIRPIDHERPHRPWKARPARRHGTDQPRHHTETTTQHRNSVSARAHTNHHEKSRLTARGSAEVGVVAVLQVVLDPQPHRRMHVQAGDVVGTGPGDVGAFVVDGQSSAEHLGGEG